LIGHGDGQGSNIGIPGGSNQFGGLLRRKLKGSTKFGRDFMVTIYGSYQWQQPIPNVTLESGGNENEEYCQTKDEFEHGLDSIDPGSDPELVDGLIEKDGEFIKNDYAG
jgi:hypothetical protein